MQSEMKMASILSSKALDAFLAGDPVNSVRQDRSGARYDLLSFGGGSCPKVVGRHAIRFGWTNMCFLTNGSDNGGSTQKIVEALRPDYGSTLPVGDITSALIGLLDPFRYKLLNLRSWKLDPERFTEKERDAFAAALKNRSSFYERVALAIKCHLDKFRGAGEGQSSACGGPARHHAQEAGLPTLTQREQAGRQARERFCAELLEVARLVDAVGIIRPGVKGLELSEASVRHHCFNAIMIRAGAYDSNRKTPDPDRFMVGLSLLQRALSIQHSVFPCSLDEQTLYAEWIDESGNAVWSTKRVSSERPVTSMGGQVALSNAPDSVKMLKNGKYARYGRFGFDPERPQPRAYPEALQAVRRMRPGGPILFGPSSFVASISPCLAVREIVGELANRPDCPRILFLNLTLNSETVGWRVTDFLDFWELNTGRPVSDTIDYVVVNNNLDGTPEIAEALTDKGDTLETFKFRGPVKLTGDERAALPGRGVNVVEAPLAAVSHELMRLSSTGDREFVLVPSHDSERLMNACRLLVQDFSDKSSRKSKPGRPRKLTLDAEGKTEAVLYSRK